MDLPEEEEPPRSTTSTAAHSAAPSSSSAASSTALSSSTSSSSSSAGTTPLAASSLHPTAIPSSSASSSSSSHPHSHSHHPHPSPYPSSSAASTSTNWRDRGSHEGTTNYSNAPELTHYLQSSFVPSVVPQPDEYAAKEQARVYLEKLADQVSPGAKLLPFGSMANGFALKNSDMDLCCFLAKDAPVRSASELVELLGRLIEQEANFYVKMLPRARIPIIKLTMPPTPSVPAGMACDIGFENRLALENTRLLLTYAMVDSRLRTLVLFLKVWTKRRKVNNPYRGTLSSYGYVLLVIHFLAHVKQPAVLPNLQRLPLSSSTPLEELTYEGHDISFYDDLDALSSVFQTQNQDTAGELLIDFFRYFSKDFNYNHAVISIRSEAGTLAKVAKGWHTDFEFDPEVIVRDQHKLCIEDPFQLDYNVARTVTRDGLYTIRGEFMRAFRILTVPARGPDGIGAVINSLCEEREDYLHIHPSDAPYPSPYQQHHPHPHPYQPSHPYQPPSSQHLQPQAPKSPRRRSAPSPSPRMGPGAYGPGLHAQPQPLQAHRGGDYPLWAAPAMNGTGPLLSRPGGGGSGSISGLSENGGSRAGTPTPPSEADDEEGTGGNGMRDAQTPTGAGSAAYAPALHPPPASLYQSAPRRPPSSAVPYPIRQQQQQSGQQRAITPTLHPGPMPSLERRSSWDGGSGGGSVNGGSKASSVAGSVAGGSAVNGQQGAGGAYDLHRFFQNPTPSSVSDVGGPTASSPTSSSLANPRASVSLTAPSSPDLAASAYFAGHPPASYGYNGRPAYRYASSPAASYSHVGPRLAASVPRNPNTAHHAYTNPYASAPVPSYPLSASTASTSSSSSYTSAATHLNYSSHSSQLPHHQHQHQQQNALPPAPAPIFPEEDRETIALQNSITFGNFPEMLPLPSYALYHASGGSSAYLAGAGGWGTTPYGISGPLRAGTRSQGGAFARKSTTGRRSLAPGLELRLDEEDDLDAAVDGLAGRGRRLADALEEGGEGARPSRTRGRSVPHVRMGPDGRETLLFGAIEVTLPKAEDVEEAEREEEEKERDQQQEVQRPSSPVKAAAAAGEKQEGTGERAQLVDSAEEAERDVAFLGPGPGRREGGEVVEQVEPETVVDIPPRALQAIPILTSQPPTPAKKPIPSSLSPAAPSQSDEHDSLDLLPSPSPTTASLPPVDAASLLGSTNDSSTSSIMAIVSSASPQPPKSPRIAEGAVPASDRSE
ncbi:hypothetical protein JCM8547_001499 [Rhodosporidiobolus lusitaniae]